tara:strand:+ start:123 stop:470 length:348 start_codon:yes stop_codon:yes gene_type:complete
MDRESSDSLEVIDGKTPSESLLVVGVPIYLAQPVILDSVEAMTPVTPRESFTMEQPSLDSFNSEMEANVSTSKVVLYTVQGYSYEAEKATEKRTGISAWLFGCCDGKRSTTESSS